MQAGVASLSHRCVRPAMRSIGKKMRHLLALLSSGEKQVRIGVEFAASSIYYLRVEPLRRSPNPIKELAHCRRCRAQGLLILIHPSPDELTLLLLAGGSYCIDQGIGFGIADERVLDILIGKLGR